MKPEILEKFIKLRALAGFLGEKAQFNWWDTNFLSPAGLQFLAVNFPRSAVAAGCNSVCEAARRLHDDRIGKGGVYHLFRLPAAIEESLHKTLIAMNPETIRAVLKDRETALAELEFMAGRTAKTSGGPVQAGKMEDLDSGSAVANLAGYYAGAFTSGAQCFPYLTDNQARP